MKNKKMILKYGLIIVIIALLVVCGIILTKKDNENGKTIETMENKVGLEVSYDIIVEIKGEVKHPGIYTLPKDTRIQDLITVAGGLTVDADSSSLNLASKLSDGMVVVVPTKQQTSNQNNDKININSASVSELCSLPGIGESLAQRIIDYRNTNGFFSTTEEIKNVSGIGDALYNKIKDYITI